MHHFLPIKDYDNLVATIHCNDLETDEFAAGGFTRSDAKTIHAPAIQEAFLNLECTLLETRDLSGAGKTAMVIARCGTYPLRKNMRRAMRGGTVRTVLCC